MTIFDKLCAKLVFGKDGKITVFGVIFIIGTIIFLSDFLSCFTGSCNVFTVRNPWSDTKVERCYQSTYMAFAVSCIVTCPQMMSDNPRDYHFSPDNILLLPLGLVVSRTVWSSWSAIHSFFLMTGRCPQSGTRSATKSVAAIKRRG